MQHGFFGGKPRVHPDFLERESPSGLRREKNQQQSQVRLNFKVFNDIDNIAKALQISLEEKHGNGGDKMRKGGQQGENERQCRKKSEQEHDKHRWAHTFSNIKWARKFHIVVVQNNVKEMYKKGAAHLQGCWFFC